jgi:uncharacterized repeat protein (TIGR04052 family)
MTTLRLAAPLLLAACTGTPPADAPDLASAGTPRAITVDFQARVGAEALACAGSYEGVGTGKEHVHPGDLRMYVHDVRLVTGAGAELPVSLAPDGDWQSGTVALLDFTGNDGECTGDAATNTTLEGSYQDTGAAITGLRFTVGVPFAENHQDATVAKAPLNVSSLFWSWNGGYKFAVVEGKAHNGKAFVLHLGSTGCIKDGSNTVTGCSAPNRVAVDLPGYALAGKKVVVDLKEILAGVDLDKGVACHSAPAQPGCPPLFTALGLPAGDMRPAGSRVFRIE